MLFIFAYIFIIIMLTDEACLFVPDSKSPRHFRHFKMFSKCPRFHLECFISFHWLSTVSLYSTLLHVSWADILTDDGSLAAVTEYVKYIHRYVCVVWVWMWQKPVLISNTTCINSTVTNSPMVLKLLMYNQIKLLEYTLSPKNIILIGLDLFQSRLLWTGRSDS
jgi:hypothetical protein